MDADVVVLGGGFAGLVAARDLAERRIRVVLLEARPRLGGRTWYRRFDGTDAYVEFGGTWFSRSLQPALAAEIDRYGVDVTPGRSGATPAWLADGTLREGPDVRSDQRDALAAFRPALDEGTSRIRSWLAGEAEAPRDLDVSAETWIESADASRAGKDLLLALTALMGGASPAEQSILTILEDAATTGYAFDEPFAEIGETLTDGTSTLVEAIADDARLRGADIRIAAPAIRVQHDGERVSVDVQGGGVITADLAVIALPLNVLTDVRFEPAITGPLHRAARERHPGSAVKVWALVEGVPEGFAGVAWPAPLMGVFGERSFDGGTLTVGFGTFGAIEAHVESVEAAIRQVSPDARVRAVDAHDWVSDRWSRGAWMAWRPGWSTGLIDDLERPQHRLTFCGSDVSRDGAGWVEGAVSSAHRAAASAERLLTRS
jgi:monoamine oxidase